MSGDTRPRGREAALVRGDRHDHPRAPLRGIGDRSGSVSPLRLEARRTLFGWASYRWIGMALFYRAPTTPSSPALMAVRLTRWGRVPYRQQVATGVSKVESTTGKRRRTRCRAPGHPKSEPARRCP